MFFCNNNCLLDSALDQTCAICGSRRTIRRFRIEAFKLQVISTITQIANMYWDLVAAYEDEQVKSRSLDFANQTLESDRKQLGAAGDSGDGCDEGRG